MFFPLALKVPAGHVVLISSVWERRLRVVIAPPLYLSEGCEIVNDVADGFKAISQICALIPSAAEMRVNAFEAFEGLV
jgi:hypothetical protein